MWWCMVRPHLAPQLQICAKDDRPPGHPGRRICHKGIAVIWRTSVEARLATLPSISRQGPVLNNATRIATPSSARPESKEFCETTVWMDPCRVRHLQLRVSYCRSRGSSRYSAVDLWVRSPACQSLGFRISSFLDAGNPPPYSDFRKPWLGTNTRSVPEVLLQDLGRPAWRASTSVKSLIFSHPCPFHVRC